MRPKRKVAINGVKVEEYYWTGKLVVYLDGHLANVSFESACAILIAKGEIQTSDIPFHYNKSN